MNKLRNKTRVRFDENLTVGYFLHGLSIPYVKFAKRYPRGGFRINKLRNNTRVSMP